MLDEVKTIRLTTDNDREVSSWVSLLTAGMTARAAAGAGGSAMLRQALEFDSGGGGGDIPAGAVDGRERSASYAVKQGARAQQERLDTLHEALSVLLPGTDVREVSGRDLIDQARHVGTDRSQTMDIRATAASQERMLETVRAKREEEERNWREHDTAQKAEIERLREELSRARGDEQLHSTEVATLKDTLHQHKLVMERNGLLEQAEIEDKLRTETDSADVVDARARAARAEEHSRESEAELRELRDTNEALSTKLQLLEDTTIEATRKNRRLDSELAKTTDENEARAERLASVQKENSELLAALAELRTEHAQLEAMQRITAVALEAAEHSVAKMTPELELLRCVARSTACLLVRRPPCKRARHRECRW